MKITPQARKLHLKEAGVYDAESLKLNLGGMLSKRQKIKLIIHSLLWFALSGMNLMGFGLLICLQFLHVEMIRISIIWMIALGIFGFLAYRRARPFWQDIQEEGIKMIAGQITKRYFFVGQSRSGSRGGGESYWLVHVHHMQFSVSPTLYSSLLDGGSYRLFYAPNSGWVLNVDIT